MTPKNKTLSICYYDNTICSQNPPHIIYPFVRSLLEWVESNDAMLIIKTKYFPAHYLWECRKYHRGQHWRKRFWRKISEKNIYENYPNDIIGFMRKLEECHKLSWSLKMDDVEPALKSDIVIVIPDGTIIHKILTFDAKKKIYFFKHPYALRNNVIDFTTPQELIAMLNK